MTNPMSSSTLSQQPPDTVNVRNNWPISQAHHQENSIQAVSECASPQAVNVMPSTSIFVISSSPLKKSASRSDAVKPALEIAGAETLASQRNSSSVDMNVQPVPKEGITVNQGCPQLVQPPTVHYTKCPMQLQRQFAAHSPTVNSLPLGVERVDFPLKRSRSETDGNETPRDRVNIDYLGDDRTRQVTLLKRKNGVMKKVMEFVSGIEIAAASFQLRMHAKVF